MKPDYQMRIIEQVPVNGDIVGNVVDDPDEDGVVLSGVKSRPRELAVDRHDGLARTQPRRVLHHHLHSSPTTSQYQPSLFFSFVLTSAHGSILSSSFLQLRVPEIHLIPMEGTV